MKLIDTIKLQFGELPLTDKAEERLNHYEYTPETLQKAVDEQNKAKAGTPKVFCGTYAKYNDGNLCGLWIDVSSFDDYDEFIDFCKAIHADEDDPELMWQDVDNYPGYLDELPNERDFEKMKEYAEICDEYSKEAADAYIALGFRPNEFADRYEGEFDSEEDFARHIIDECYNLDDIMGNFAPYFDYAAYARDLFMGDFLQKKRICISELLIITTQNRLRHERVSDEFEKPCIQCGRMD